MSSHDPGKSEMTTDIAVIRGVLPRNGPKHLARLMAVPVETARHWYYKHLSAVRRRELALALLTEMDAQDARRATWREHLQCVAGENGEVGGVLAGAVAEAARAREAGAAAGEVRRGVECADRGAP